MKYDVTTTLGLLKKSRSIFKKKRWIKYAFFLGGTETCPEGVCMAGALNLAAHGNATARPRWGTNTYNAHYYANSLLIRAAEKQTNVNIGMLSVGAYNDYYAKTKKQAIELFDIAIELEEERLAALKLTSN